MDKIPMEPQHFGLKRWFKTLQLTSSVLLIVFGTSNLFVGGWSVFLGVLFLAFGMYTLGQAMYAGVVATEEGLNVRLNMPKPRFYAWEDIDYASPGAPLTLRLLDGKLGRIPPYLNDADELRWMIDDTVGSAPG
ncbi:MAG: hypothetical protein GY708_01195 [Actinomycetia bacterium]|nr:hypothetical protein [Actinomycetes bacterium]MCP4963549.1 hypothetical protein [Actinomycetes bacterium]